MNANMLNISGSKRRLSFGADPRIEGQKRTCLSPDYDPNDDRILSHSDSTRECSLKTASWHHGINSTNNVLSHFPASFQDRRDLSEAANEHLLYCGLVPAELGRHDLSVAPGQSFPNTPSIEITTAFSDDFLARSSSIHTTQSPAYSLLSKSTPETQYSIDTAVSSSAIRDDDVDEYPDESHVALSELFIPKYNSKLLGTYHHETQQQGTTCLAPIWSTTQVDGGATGCEVSGVQVAESNGWDDLAKQATSGGQFEQGAHDQDFEGVETMVTSDVASIHLPSGNQLSCPVPHSNLQICQTILPTMNVTSAASDLISSYDMCFGMVPLTFRSSVHIESKKDQIAVNMAVYGDMLKLSFSDSGKYAGLVEAAALGTLLQNPAMTLTATLSVTKRGEEDTDEGLRSIDCSLRVLICGQASEKQAVAKLLSDAGLYLQHPFLQELGDLKYDNPHFLLRPGYDMPSLEQLSIMSDSEVSESPEILDESSISLVMRVFDSESIICGSLTTKASDRLRSTLKDHQYKALAMMQEKECGIVEDTNFPSLWQPIVKSDGKKMFRHTVTGVVESSPKLSRGGILADEMGLGKTLSILALICWSLDMRAERDFSDKRQTSGSTLIVAPKSTINSWQEQIKRHIKAGRINFASFHGTSRKCFSKSKECDIVLTTYETMRSDWSTKRILFSQQWDRVVLDEAHHIRKASSQTFKAACELKASHRWCLTGTPICNSLDDFGSLLTFISVQPLADRKAFRSWILDPIKDKRQDGLTRLESLVRATCLRRKKSHTSSQLQLPPQSEKIHWVELSQHDQELYRFFKSKTAKLAVDRSLRRLDSRMSTRDSDLNTVTFLNTLRLICDHGEHLLPPSALDLWTKQNEEESVSSQLQNLIALCDICQKRAGSSTDSGFGCEHVICAACTSSIVLDPADEDDRCPKCVADCSTAAGNLLRCEPKTQFPPSFKLKALTENLRCEQNPNSTLSRVEAPIKSLVFSFWAKMLDLIQHHLEREGFTIARIDGSCSLQQRSEAIRRFNENRDCTVMLASIGSAGEGIDLTAANHVHLLEPHWNPMQEAQAINRVHRIGQQRAVHTVRYLTRNSIETYVQWIQKQKIRLINQSLDSVHVSQTEIEEQRWEKLKQYIGSVEIERQKNMLGSEPDVDQAMTFEKLEMLE